MRAPALVALFAFAAAGCATKADVQTLERSMQEDLGQIQADQLQLLDQLRGAVDSLDAADARRESTGRGAFERRVAELERLMGELLDMVAQNNRLLADLYASRSASGAGPRGSGGAGGLPGPGEATPPADQPGGTGEAGAFYALALEQFRVGNLETARGAFQDFLAQYPGHDLAPDALYHIARTYEDAGDVGAALTEYQRVTELYPDSNRAPTALWRRGLIELDRGNTAVARRLFTQVETGYPNSPEAPLARQELEKLGG